MEYYRGGIANANGDDELDKDKNNSDYQSCYKRKDFTDIIYYWTSEEMGSNRALGLYFERGIDSWYSKSREALALCVR